MRAHKRTFSIAAVIVSTLAAGTLTTACARRPHTNPEFGVNNRAFFDRQARAAYSGSAQGLDSEEAATIHQQYRQGMGAKRGAQSTPDPKSSVLILQEDKRDAAKRP